MQPFGQLPNQKLPNPSHRPNLGQLGPCYQSLMLRHSSQFALAHLHQLALSHYQQPSKHLALPFVPFQLQSIAVAHPPTYPESSYYQGYPLQFASIR